MEKVIKPMNGFLALLLSLITFAGAIICFVNAESGAIYIEPIMHLSQPKCTID